MNWQLTEWNEGVKLVNKPPSVVVKLAAGHLNSIYTNATVKLGQIIKIDFGVSVLEGNPQFVSMDGGAPANFSPMICKNTALDGRWYIAGDPLTNCVLLRPTLVQGSRSWKLTPMLWQDVNGKQNAVAFKQGVAEARILEIVFGGKFRAHGIQVNGGRVKIELTITIQ